MVGAKSLDHWFSAIAQVSARLRSLHGQRYGQTLRARLEGLRLDD